MTPDRWQELNRLFHDALKCEPDQRGAFLAQACGGDASLLREVESLISFHDQSNNFIERPASDVAAELFAVRKSELLLGQQIAYYTIRSSLGAGGMGEVYLADDTRLGRAIALKFLPAHFTADPERVRRFEQEARAASALNHPNIVTIHEIGRTDSTHFIATEFIDGRTLREQLAGGALKPEEALDIATQAASALAAAHSAGIVHRDIKPENVMVRRDGIVKVLDFGLAKLVLPQIPTTDTDSPTKWMVHTNPGMVLGTLRYMSPEQARGQDVDSRTDIWSLGVMLYEMLTGRPPFEGETPSHLIVSILESEPSSVARYAKIPAELERIVTKALRKKREERFQTASDLALDLKSLKQELEVEARMGRSHRTAPENVRTSTNSDDRAVGGIVYESPAMTSDVTPADTTSGAEYLVGEFKRHKRSVVIALAGLVAAASLTLFFWLKAPTPPPKVSAYTQITKDSRPKKFVVTDGARVYFTVYTTVGGGNYQVSASGGDSIPITNTIPDAFSSIMDISRDGTELLMATSTTDIGEWPLWVQPLLGGSPRRVGDILAHFAAWSPDGKQIVYGSGSELLIANADGSESRKLTRVDGIPERPRWSPDGGSVRFTVLNPKDNASSLWEVGANGTNLHALLPGWNPSPAECCGSWTEDGRYYFFQATRNSATNIWAIKEGGGFFRTADREPVQVTSGPINFSVPVPSRDGRKLFVIGDLPRGELVRYDTKSGQLVPFMQGLSIEHLDLSSDGEWATYVSYPEGTLWRSRVDGTQRLQLTSPPMRTAVPRWSPDQKRIVFGAALPGQPWKTYVVPVEGGSAQQWVPELRNALDASWSPDGNKLVFGFTKEDAGTQGIHVLDVTMNQTSMVPSSGGLFAPRWSPDGRYISAISTDNQRLVLFDLATQKWEELAKTGVAYPSWSRDGKYVYFSTGIMGGPPAVVRVRIRDRQLELVASLKSINIAYGVFGPWLGLASDDSPLMLRYIGTQEIYALDLQLP